MSCATTPLCIETAAARLGVVLVDGFSHAAVQRFNRDHFQHDIVRRSSKSTRADYLEGVFHSYKLHGSVDWRRQRDGVVIRSQAEATEELRPVLIYPRSTKYQEAFETPYLDMFAALQEALREPDTTLIVSGFSSQPRVGDGVYLADGSALSASIQDALRGGADEGAAPLMVNLGTLAGLEDAEISIPPEKLFGRHCGVFGATGGGKSWTVSRLVNEVVRIGGKCILFDPTGEFTGKVAGARQFAFAEATLQGQPLVRFPSKLLSELDLHALLTPTGQSQGPMLRGATKSLRMSKALRDAPHLFTQEAEGNRTKVLIRQGENPFGYVVIEEHGSIEKANQSRVAFGRAELLLAEQLAAEQCDFDFRALSRQVRNECVRPVGNDGARSC